MTNPGESKIPEFETVLENGPLDAEITPLATALGQAKTLRRIAYRGASTAAAFTETPAELAALLTHAGAYDLGWRGFLRCAGEDRVRWLNGMVTNSVAGLSVNQGCYAFVLNAQGRIQGDLSIYRHGNTLWLQTDRTQIDTLATFLDRYIIMDDVILERVGQWTAMGIAGPQAAQVLDAAGFSVSGTSPMHLAETSWNGRPAVLVASYSPLVPRFEIWCSPEDVLQVWKALADCGAAPCGTEAVEQLRIVEGTPAYSIDITGRDLPQETGQMRALHFSKGCYLGQEIVERIRSRGNVHRTFSGFILQNSCGLAPSNARMPLLAEDKSVGELSSLTRVVFPDGAERVLALGTVRREALERKTALTANGCTVVPASLPFDFAPSAVQP